MIIRNFQESVNSKSITLSADVRFSGESKVHRVFYNFNKEHKKYLSIDATSLLAAFLLPAMLRKEKIYVEGSVSEKFLTNTKKIMRLFHSWDRRFAVVKIHISSRKKDTQKSSETACFFSLGVDSFYTYLKHKKAGNKLQNLIFVDGFDIALTSKTLFRKSLESMKQIKRAEKVFVIPVVTNLKTITDSYVDWEWEHGAAMASIALLLRKKIRQVYFAASEALTQRPKDIPYGTHPKLDHLWSTEHIKIIHDGNESTRLQKILRIVSKSSLALRLLRVCNQNRKNSYNCSFCEKCLRTMIDLEIAGVLKKAKTFRHTIPLERLRKVQNASFMAYLYFEDSLKELKRRGKNPKLQKALEESIYRSKNPSPLLRFFQFLSHLDRKYNKSRILNFVFQYTENEDRNILFKIFSKMSLIH